MLLPQPPASRGVGEGSSWSCYLWNSHPRQGTRQLSLLGWPAVQADTKHRFFRRLTVRVVNFPNSAILCEGVFQRTLRSRCEAGALRHKGLFAKFGKRLPCPCWQWPSCECWRAAGACRSCGQQGSQPAARCPQPFQGALGAARPGCAVEGPEAGGAELPQHRGLFVLCKCWCSRLLRKGASCSSACALPRVLPFPGRFWALPSPVLPQLLPSPRCCSPLGSPGCTSAHISLWAGGHPECH